MDSLRSGVLEALREKGCEPVLRDGILCVTVRGCAESYPLYILVGDGAVLSVACWPYRIPDERQMEMGHFLHLANFGLLLGCFELDFDQGDLRYRCACLCEEGIQPNRGTLLRSIFTPIRMLEAYAPGIRAVTNGEYLARGALELCV